MRTWRRVVIAVMVVATALLFYRWWQAASAKADRRPRATAEADDPEPASTRGASGGARPGAPGAPEPGASPEGPKLDRPRADEMRERLHALFAEAGALALMGGSPVEPDAAPEAGPPRPFAAGAFDAGPEKLSPEYIKDRVHEDLFPLAKGCYADALKRNPKLAGRLSVAFRIIGDPKVGGVVDEAHMADDTTIADAEMQTCVRESMMSVSFDAPPNGGEVTVIYPIEFSPDDDDAGD
jgi:hypothetical protein